MKVYMLSKEMDNVENPIPPLYVGSNIYISFIITALIFEISDSFNL